MKITYDHPEIVSMLDSTLLRPDITLDDLQKLCSDALKYGFAAVIVNPRNVRFCVKLLKNSKVKVGTVVGFPLGEDLVENKIDQIKSAVKDGANDIDVVACISLVKQNKWEEYAKEVARFAKAAKGKTLKLIVETCYLTPDEIAKACQICVANQVRFVKTSTGYGTRGASLEDIAVMTKAIKEAPRDFDADLFVTGIKASGGIKTFSQAKALAEAGATRIGTSNAEAIALYKDAKEAPQAEPVLPVAVVEPPVSEPFEEALTAVIDEPVSAATEEIADMSSDDVAAETVDTVQEQDYRIEDIGDEKTE